MKELFSSNPQTLDIKECDLRELKEHTFSEWLDVYKSFIADTVIDAQKCIDDFRCVCKNKHIVLWGANMHGKTSYKLLQDIGIKVDLFVDRNFDKIKSLNNVAVISPRQLSTECPFPYDEVLLFSSVNMKNYYSVKSDFSQMDIPLQLCNGMLFFYPLQTSACLLKAEQMPLNIKNCFACSRYGVSCNILKSNILKHKDCELNHGGSRLTTISYILGTICSLKCKHCVEQVPYVAKDNKHFVPKETVLIDIRNCAAASEFIAYLDFVGGEPFLHPEFADILKEVRKIKNIGVIDVFTNGTIAPSEELIEQLCQNYTSVHVSDYSNKLTQKQRQRVENNLDLLLNAGVSVFHAKDYTWTDTLSFDHVNDDNEQLEHRFKNCIFRDCHRLYEGKLFHCVHEYAGHVTNSLMASNNVVLVNEEPDTLCERLNNFVDLPFIEACKYCEMPFNSKTVPSGEQTV